MRKFLILSLFAILNSTLFSAEYMSLKHIGSYHTGLFDKSGAEITCYDPTTKSLYLVNAVSSQLVVLDIQNPSNPILVRNIDLSTWGALANSVDVHNGIVAVAVESQIKTDNGHVVFFDKNGNYIHNVAVGALPDMLKFTSNGNYVLVCNEGEPNNDYTIDPEGSISVIDLRNGIANAVVRDANFRNFNGQEVALRNQGIRIFGPNASASKDLEPEYLTIDKNNQYAYATLQENNAIAKIDIANASIVWVKPLGYKNHNLLGNELDASDKDGKINIKNLPVYGMYMPDAIDNFEVNGTSYLITANEGDARDYNAFSEETTVAKVKLDTIVFPNYIELQKPENLGRLNITKTMGDENQDGRYEKLYSFGGRSFSIWDINGNMIFDSGSEIEKKIAELLPNYFNINNTSNEFDNRSDNKGPEPEAVIVADINSQKYAFVALERVGGIMVYNISNPHQPYYVTYTNNRNFNAPFPKNPNADELLQIGDLGPESVIFIPTEKSPNNQNLIVVANEISGSVSIFQVIMAPQVNLVDKSICKRNKINIGNVTPSGLDITVLNGSGNYTYNWSNASYLNDATISNPTYKDPIFTKTFVLTVLDNETNLTAKDSMVVTVSQNSVYVGMETINRHPKNTVLDLNTLLKVVTGTAPFINIWKDKNNNIISDPTNIIPAIGFNSYYITVQDATGCQSITKRANVYVSPFQKESIEEQILSENGTGIASFYPTPVENELNLITYFDNSDNLNVSIYNLNGELVLFENIQNNTTSSINTSKLVSGMYLINITNGIDNIKSKIIKR